MQSDRGPKHTNAVNLAPVVLSEEKASDGFCFQQAEHKDTGVSGPTGQTGKPLLGRFE